MNTSTEILNVSMDSFIKYQEYSPDTGLSELKNIDRVTSICGDLWHLTDHIWNEYKKHLHKKYSDIGAFRKELLNDCNELGILHDIFTQKKHAVISRPKSEFSKLEVYEGNLICFSDPPAINVVFKNNSKINITIILEKVFYFWRDYISELKTQ